MSDHRADDLSIDIGPLRPTPGAVHIAGGLPDGLEDRVLAWFIENRVIGAVDFWRQENQESDRQNEESDLPDDVDLYLVVATDDSGAVQVLAEDGSVAAGPPLQELRWRLRSEVGADDVVFDDWEGAALWSAHDTAAAIAEAAERAQGEGLPVPEINHSGIGASPFGAADDARAEDETDEAGAVDADAAAQDWQAQRWEGPSEPEPQHVLAFSHRGTAHGHLLAAQAGTAVQAGHRDGWSVFRYTSDRFIELNPPRKGELPAITVRHGRDDFGDAWVEIDTHGNPNDTGFGLWPAARSAMRPVFAAGDLQPTAAAVQARVLDESLDPDSDLQVLAADDVLADGLDLTVLNRGVAPHPPGQPQTPSSRVEAVLIGLGLPAELVLPAVRGHDLPDQIEFAPAGVVDAVLQTVAAGRAGIRPIGEPLTTWDTVEQRVRRDPKWAAGLVSTELVLGIAALWAGRKVGRRSRTAGGLLTVLGVTALADAVFEAFLTGVRQSSGQPFDYRGATD